MKRPAPIIALTLLALFAGACGGPNPEPAGEATTTSSPGPLFDRLPLAQQIDKEIKVGSAVEYPPLEFFKEGTEEVQGLDYELAQALGTKLGVKMTFVNHPGFAGLVGALKGGQFDIVMSAMKDTEERRSNGVDFIDYFSAGSSILVRKGNSEHITRIEDLCGHSVAVQKGTVQDTDILTPQEPECKKEKKPLKVLRLEKDAEALQQVKNGNAVATVEEFPVAVYNAQTSGGGASFEVVPGQLGRVGFYGIAVDAEDTRLRDALRDALRAVIDDGTYDQILAKWNLTAGALKTAAINGGA